MMYSYSAGAGLLHGLGALAFFTGVLLLLFWAFKHLTPHQLKRYGIILAITGLVLCILSFGLLSQGGFAGKKMLFTRSVGGMMNHGNVMMMSMDGMTGAMSGKTGDELDAIFLEMMIAHHQGAIDMSNGVLTSAKHTEIKTMAKAIIAAQQKEITQMQAWQKAWGYTK